jgi:phosphoglycolate phosphatase-like HAD superfamily hydrolase
VIPRFPVYLFDIDGTLLDSAEDICGAVQHVLAATPTPKDLPFEYLKGICLPRRKEDDNTGTRLQRQVERLSGLDRNDWIRGPRDLVS